MTYKVEFLDSALKEWNKLNPTVQKDFAKKLKSILDSPRIEKNKLTNMKDCYKIKLRSIGYRLVYKVIDEKVIIQVIAVGKREGNKVYLQAIKRL